MPEVITGPLEKKITLTSLSLKDCKQVELVNFINNFAFPLAYMNVMMCQVVKILFPQFDDLINTMDNSEWLKKNFGKYYIDYEAKYGRDGIASEQNVRSFLNDNPMIVQNLRKLVPDESDCSSYKQKLEEMNARLASARIIAACSSRQKGQSGGFGRVKRRKTAKRRKTTAKRRKTTAKRKTTKRGKTTAKRKTARR